MALNIKGKTCAVTGTLKTMSRAEAQTRMEEMGAIISKSVSSKTDYLVAGARAGSKISKAKRWGVTILNEDQLIALLEGKEDEEVEQKATVPTPVKPADLDEVLRVFRELLYETPTQQTWDTICELLDRCPDYALGMALDYVEGHIAHWPDEQRIGPYRNTDNTKELREAPYRWVEDILAGNDSPRYRMVRRVNCHGKRLVGKLAMRLLESQHLTQVRSIALGSNKLSATFFKKFAQSPNFQHLTHFSFHDNHNTKPNLAKAMSGIWQLPLTHVSLRGSRFPDGGFAHFLHGADCSGLQYLNADYCSMGDNGALALATASKGFPNIVTLQLDGNSISDKAGLALFENAPMPNLRTLNLYANNMGPETFQHTFAPNTRLQMEEVNITDNKVGNEGAIQVAQATHLTNLKSLSVHRVNMGIEGIRALLHAPHIISLQSLSLGYHIHGDYIAQTIAANPDFKNLTSLGLYDTDLTDDGLRLLAHEAPHLHSLQYLSLGEGKLTPASQEIIATSPYFSKQLLQYLARDLRYLWNTA